jgi:hypothetical protein
VPDPVLIVCILLPTPPRRDDAMTDPLGDDPITRCERAAAARWQGATTGPVFGIWETLGLDRDDEYVTLTFDVPHTPDQLDQVRAFALSVVRPLFRGPIRLAWVHPPVIRVDWESF